MSDETKTPAETYAEHNGAAVTPETACQCADCQAHAAATTEAPAAPAETTLQKVEQTVSREVVAIEAMLKELGTDVLLKMEAGYELILDKVREQLHARGE